MIPYDVRKDKRRESNEAANGRLMSSVHVSRETITLDPGMGAVFHVEQNKPADSFVE